MQVLDQDLLQKAWNFACNAHNGQSVPGSDLPYVNHIGNVMMEAMTVATKDDVKRPVLLVQVAILHDTLEDTHTTCNELSWAFGVPVAKGVMALTKDESLHSKREMMADSIRRIKKQPKEVWMVKLCDRIVNLQPPPQHWDKVKIVAYRDEAILIANELGGASQALAERLQEKITSYGQYIASRHSLDG